jgi:quercetin dioxygenase-like cupin family protein
MTDRFEDHRGVIQDILSGPIDQVTEIFTKAGSVRGNHIHRQTVQWTYIAWGSLLVAWDDGSGAGPQQKQYGPGSLITEPAKVPHAWKALEDTLVLVFTRGPRSGEDYESDTHRLERPIL